MRVSSSFNPFKSILKGCKPHIYNRYNIVSGGKVTNIFSFGQQERRFFKDCHMLFSFSTTISNQIKINKTNYLSLSFLISLLDIFMKPLCRPTAETCCNLRLITIAQSNNHIKVVMVYASFTSRLPSWRTNKNFL